MAGCRDSKRTKDLPAQDPEVLSLVPSPSRRRTHECRIRSEVDWGGAVLLFPFRKERGKSLRLLPAMNLSLQAWERHLLLFTRHRILVTASGVIRENHSTGFY